MPQEETSSFGVTLRRWRELRHLSQGELAVRSGDIDQSYISRLERDLHSPTLEMLCRLARALDVDPRDLLVCPDVPTAEAV